MKKFVVTGFILIMLLLPTLSESAVKKEDFIIKTSVVPTKIITWVFVREGKPVYNVVLNFSKVPEGIKLKENNTKVIPYIPSKGIKKIIWKAVVEKNKTYNLTNAFEVVFWDNSVSLTASLVKDNTTTNETIATAEPEIVVYGKTDGEEFCEYMKKLPGEENNPLWDREDVCRVKIIINNEKPFYANSSGFFLGKVKLTKPGINEINVTAVDVGGNTNTVILKVNYTGVQTQLELVDVGLVVLAVVGLILIFAVVGGLMFFFIKKPKKKKTKPSEVEKKPSKIVKKFKKEPKTLNELKERKIKLKKRLDKLSKKKTLTDNEKLEKNRLEKELNEIVDKLLTNDEYLFELEERAFKALVDAHEGKPSKQIKKELIKEGYTEREISKIREFFVRGKK